MPNSEKPESPDSAPKDADRSDRVVDMSDFLVLERLALHKEVDSPFGFQPGLVGLVPAWWEKGMKTEDAEAWCADLGEDFHKINGTMHRGDERERARALEVFEKGLSLYGLTRGEAVAKGQKKDKVEIRKWCQAVAFFATDCAIADLCEIIERTSAQVVEELHGSWYEDGSKRCIDEISLNAYAIGVLAKPFDVGDDPFGPVEYVELSWSEKAADR